MLEALIEGLIAIFAWPTFGLMLLGIAIGFWVGLLPGLGSVVTLALMLPFVFTMTPMSAFAFLLGMYSVTNTTGDITSILFAIPGETSSAALILDGHAMAKRGEAGRALGAALFSSFIGAVVGALALAASIPIIQPLVLSFGPPEIFALAVVGVSLISSLSGDCLLRGLIAGGFGFLLSTIGMDPQTSIPRFTFGETYLLDGLSVVPVIVGLFAIPEIVDLAIRGQIIAGDGTARIDNAFEGVKDTLRHWGLTIRCSIIGTVVGIIPGLGGGIGQWLAYGHAVQSARDKSLFGKGAVEGVIGPGAANNSTAGSSLIPTVAFGVPGSIVMAVLLGAFLITGIAPGPDMLTRHLSLTFSMVWIVIVSNLITVPLCFLLLNQIAKITRVRSSLLAPFLLFFAFLGALATTGDVGDLVSLVIFGLLGYVMVAWNWPRPPLLLGFVLGTIAERNLWLSVQMSGIAWAANPIVVVLILIAVGSFFYPLVRSGK
ncbi:MAG: tripartite tricarboxylate transporter permease [Deltaproteobacteria bacterium]|nr:tripartite tricarboxylate transporter permease [Deltaproteobacteria bacterium]